MGLKSFALGAAAVYGISYITKTRIDGTSILSDFMEDPATLFGKRKEVVPEEVYVVTVPVNHEQPL